nr:intermembrane lipid transfer protein Vps13-like [Cherax quadricarinatus]
MVLAGHGHIFTKIKFSFTVEAMTLALFTGGGDAHVTSTTSNESSNGSSSKPSQSPSDESSGQHTDIVAASSLLGESGKLQSPTHIFYVSSDESLRAHSVFSKSGHKIMMAKRALAEVSLQVVRMKGTMMSDGSLAANLVLFDCILQDTRPDQDGFITRMMERKARSGERGMVDLTYRQEPSKDIYVDVRISGFVLVLHLPYLLSIQRFFTDNLPQQPDSPSPVKPKDTPKPKNDSSVDERPSNIMTVRVKVEQPDIALVEDVSSLDTSCIILHAEVNSDIKQTPMSQNISASIANLQMYTCCYNPQNRQKTLAQILNKCELSLLCSVTPSHAEHVDIKLSQVDLRVSPGTIELLSSIGTTLSSLEAAAEEITEKVCDWTGIWEQKPLHQAEFAFLAVEEAEEAISEETSELVAAVHSGPGGEMAIITMECLLITLETGSVTSPIPLIKLQTSVSASATGFRSQKVNLTGEVSTELAYYNPRLAVWEPLLEPVEVTEKLGSPEHVPWTLHFEVEILFFYI